MNRFLSLVVLAAIVLLALVLGGPLRVLSFVFILLRNTSLFLTKAFDGLDTLALKLRLSILNRLLKPMLGLAKRLAA